MQSKLIDGRLMTTAYNAERAEWTFAVRGHEVIILPRASLSLAVLERATIEGMSDRCVDTGAIDRKAPDGHIRTEKEMAELKFAAVSAIVAYYATGTEAWSRKGAGGSADGGLIIEAIMSANGESREAALARVDAWVKSLGKPRSVVLDSFASNPRVARAMENIRAKRVAALNIDTESMLDDLPAVK